MQYMHTPERYTVCVWDSRILYYVLYVGQGTPFQGKQGMYVL